MHESFKPRLYPTNLSALQAMNPTAAELVESLRARLESEGDRRAGRHDQTHDQSDDRPGDRPGPGAQDPRSPHSPYDGELAEEVSEEVSTMMEIEPMTGKRDFPTAAFRGRLLHSKLDPDREAKKIVDRAVDPGAQLHIFCGFGYGYHLEEALSRYEDSHLVVIERHAAVLLTAMRHRDLSKLLADQRLRIILNPKPEELRSLLSPFARKKIATIALDQFTNADEDFYAGVQQALRELSSRREVNMATLNRFGKLWVRNLLKNLPVIAEAGDVGKLEGVFNGIPALLLAAGPSLDEVLPHIEEIRRRAVIIAVDTAAGALISAGHAPDIMVVVDPQYWNTRHLDDALRSHRLLRHTILVSESSTHPRIFRIPAGRVLMGGSLFPLGEYIEQAAGERRKLGAGGSVATTAWDVAALTGSSVVYTAGLDLGFPGGKTHYSGGFFETLLHSISDRFAPYAHRSFSYVMGGDPFLHANNVGGTTLTDRRLTVYRRWFEEQVLRPDAPPTINLSPGAIRIEGIEYRPLGEILELPERRQEIDGRLYAIPGEQTHELSHRRRKLRSRLDTLIEELSTLRETAEEGLETIESLRTDPGEQRRRTLLFRLEQIDARIRRSAGKEIVGFILQPILEEILGEVGYANTLEESLQQSERIYGEIKAAAGYHILIINKS